MADTPSPTIPFEEDLFVVLGAQNSSEDEKAILLARMIEIVQTRVMEKIYNALTEQEREEFMRLLESTDSDDVNTYVSQRVPNFQNLYEEEGRILRQELIVKLAK